MLLDTVFGVAISEAEIKWKRTSAHSDANTMRVHVADNILFYARQMRSLGILRSSPYTEEYVETKYRHRDADGRRFRLDNMT